MQKRITVYKPIGLTPLEIITSIKTKRPELADIPITYAGRLDPLAHGVLLLLIGEEIEQKEKYLSLTKAYEFEVIFGIETDTYDLLGYVKEMSIKQAINVNLFVNTFVNSHIGKQLQFYPPYSSKAVQGKPLFWWARNNRLGEIEIPKHEIEIYEFRCLSVGEITLKALEQKVKASLSAVHGDFRQEEISTRWAQLFSQSVNKPKVLNTAKFHIKCTSGTYVRELAQQMGGELGCGAIALDILRTAIGKYTLKETFKLKSNSYGVFEIT